MIKPDANFLSFWFGLVMVIVVIAGAIAFTFTDFMTDRIYGGKRNFFIIILLAYAIYRSFRLYQMFKQSRNEN